MLFRRLETESRKCLFERIKLTRPSHFPPQPIITSKVKVPVKRPLRVFHYDVVYSQVQRANTNLNIYISIAELIPSLVVVLAYGAYSDRMGRRLLFIVPCVGSIIQVDLT